MSLHSLPLLERLQRDLASNPRNQAAGVVLPPLPKTGDLDLQAVRHSTYFFS